MFGKFKTHTLVLIAIASAVILPLAAIVALPVVTGSDWLASHLFWTYSVEPDAISYFVDIGMYVYYAAATLIAIAAVVCGSLPLHTLYKRYRSNASSEWTFVIAAICAGLSLSLTFIMYVYLPLTISW